MPHERVAEEVRAVLARKRISGRHAARDLGWKPGYMHRRLSGEAPFDVNDLAALAGLLEVPITVFFSGVEPGTPQAKTAGDGIGDSSIAVMSINTIHPRTTWPDADVSPPLAA